MTNLLKTYDQAGKQAATVGASLEAIKVFNFCISMSVSHPNKDTVVSGCTACGFEQDVLPVVL